jgi:hypothetical protein
VQARPDGVGPHAKPSGHASPGPHGTTHTSWRVSHAPLRQSLADAQPAPRMPGVPPLKTQRPVAHRPSGAGQSTSCAQVVLQKRTVGSSGGVVHRRDSQSRGVTQASPIAAPSGQSRSTSPQSGVHAPSRLHAGHAVEPTHTDRSLTACAKNATSPSRVT